MSTKGGHNNGSGGKGGDKKKHSPVARFKKTVERLSDDKHDRKDLKKFNSRTAKKQPNFNALVTGAVDGKGDKKDYNQAIKRLQGRPYDHKGGGGKGGKGGGKGKGGKGKKHKSPYYKSAKKLVKHELKPQLQEIKRYIENLRNQGQRDVAFEKRLGTRTQTDLEAIFGRAKEFNTDQSGKIAQVLGQAQNGLGTSYNTSAENIDNAYNKANESAQETLSRLGITPVSSRLQEDQAWLQGLNEQNRTGAAQALAAQQGIFAQGSGMLGQAIAGEQATQQGTAATATAEAIRRARENANMQIADVKSQRKDIKSQRGAMINDAQQLLKQQAFEQMMEQAQLSAMNKKAAAEMKLNWAQLNETAQYHQGMLQNQSNRLAFDISKQQQDHWIDLHNLKKDGSSTKKDFLNSDLSGWKDAAQYSLYAVGRNSPKAQKAWMKLITSLQSGWGGQQLDWDNSAQRQQMISKARAKMKELGISGKKNESILWDVISIGRGKF